MARHIPDDIRYMTHETRIAEGHMRAPERVKAHKIVETCYCGKTVIATHGRATGLTCPRNCEEHREL